MPSASESHAGVSSPSKLERAFGEPNGEPLEGSTAATGDTCARA